VAPFTVYAPSADPVPAVKDAAMSVTFVVANSDIAIAVDGSSFKFAWDYECLPQWDPGPPITTYLAKMVSIMTYTWDCKVFPKWDPGPPMTSYLKKLLMTPTSVYKMMPRI
jgi:hypothetical protein